MSNFGRLICYISVIQTFNNLSADRQHLNPKEIKMDQIRRKIAVPDQRFMHLVQN